MENKRALFSYSDTVMYHRYFSQDASITAESWYRDATVIESEIL